MTTTNYELAAQSVKDTSDWAIVKDDPVFQQIPDNGPCIPIKDLIPRRGLSEHHKPIMLHDAEEGELTPTPATACDEAEQKDITGWNVLDNLEHALNSVSATKQRHSTRQKSIDSETMEPRFEVADGVEKATSHAGDGMLITLRGNGYAKSSQGSAPPCPPPKLDVEPDHGSSRPAARSRSRSLEEFREPRL